MQSPNLWLQMFLLSSIEFFLVISNLAIIVPPSSVNVTLAIEGFISKCIANKSAENLLFLINGTYVKEGLKGFSEGVLITNGDTKMRILTVTVSLKINNTNISCRAYNRISEDTSEPPALILVQGALDPPMVTNTSIINNTGVYISWTPPPTLEGTVINGYYVSSTTGDSVYTEDDNVTLSITNPDPCGINISIVAYNGINGTAAEVKNIILPSIPYDGVLPVTVVLLNRSLKIVNSLIRVNVSELCPGEYPTSVLIDITNSTGSSVFSNTLDLVPSSSQSNCMDSTSTISLSADHNYNITITPMNVLGNFISSTKRLSITSETRSSDEISVANSVYTSIVTVRPTVDSNNQLQKIAVGISCGFVAWFGIWLIIPLIVILLITKKRTTFQSLDDSIVQIEESEAYRFEAEPQHEVNRTSSDHEELVMNSEQPIKAVGRYSHEERNFKSAPVEYYSSNEFVQTDIGTISNGRFVVSTANLRLRRTKSIS